MADSIRERILANLRTTLEGITVAGGFNTDVSLVYEGEIGTEVLTRSGVGIAFEDGEEEYEQKNVNRLNKALPISIVAVQRVDAISGDQTVRAFGRALLADIEKALMVDWTRGGLATDTLMERSDIISGETNSPYLVVALGIKIRYFQRLNDPTLQ